MLPVRAGCRGRRCHCCWPSVGRPRLGGPIVGGHILGGHGLGGPSLAGHSRLRRCGLPWRWTTRLRDRPPGRFPLHSRRRLRGGRVRGCRIGQACLIGLAHFLGLHWLPTSLGQSARSSLFGLTRSSGRGHRPGHALRAGQPAGPVARTERALGAAVPGIPRAGQGIFVGQSCRIRLRQDGSAWHSQRARTWPGV